MRYKTTGAFCLLCAFALAACGQGNDAEVNRAVQTIDQVSGELNEVILTTASPEEAVAHFQSQLAKEPDRIDLQRGLGKSLIRAGRATEGAVIMSKVVDTEDATNEDRVDYATALIRNSDWAKAQEVLSSIPPTYETFERYRLEAIVADTQKKWKKADSFYLTAAGLTTRPASIYNNWGYSMLSRGNYKEAERLFSEAITYDPNLFTAKNNLILARGVQKKYDLPILQTNQEERAQLLYTMALTAVKQGDIGVGKDLLSQAIDTHPRHFDAAVRSLSKLEGK